MHCIHTQYIRIHTNTYNCPLEVKLKRHFISPKIVSPLAHYVGCFPTGPPVSQSVSPSSTPAAAGGAGGSRASRWRDVNLKWPPRRDISYHRWHIMFDAFPLARQSVCLSVHHWPRPPLEGPVVVGPRDEETWTWSGLLEETFRFKAGTRHRNAVDFDRIFGVYLVVSVPLPPFLAYNTWHLASKCSHKQKFQDSPNGCSVWVICFRFEHCFQVSRIYFDWSFDLCCKSALLT